VPYGVDAYEPILSMKKAIEHQVIQVNLIDVYCNLQFIICNNIYECNIANNIWLVNNMRVYHV
jgi:hypothetical protein